jgi:hypothetical protein
MTLPARDIGRSEHCVCIFSFFRRADSFPISRWKPCRPEPAVTLVAFADQFEDRVFFVRERFVNLVVMVDTRDGNIVGNIDDAELVNFGMNSAASVRAVPVMPASFGYIRK